MMEVFWNTLHGTMAKYKVPNTVFEYILSYVVGLEEGAPTPERNDGGNKRRKIDTAGA